MPDWAWWLVLAVLLLAGEVAVFTAFILGPLAIAAVAAAIVAVAGGSIEAQLAVFAIGGVVMILALRPLTKRHLHSPVELRTNVDALVGKPARVLRAMDFDTPGLIRLENENWTAAPAPGVEEVGEGELVTVVEIKGATAIVKPVEEEKTPQ